MLNITTSLLLKSASFQIGNFQNPPTTTPIENIVTMLTDLNDVPKAGYLNTSMTNLTPKRITTTVIGPTSSQIVGATDVIFTVTFTTMNIFLTSYQIWFLIPLWDP